MNTELPKTTLRLRSLGLNNPDTTDEEYQTAFDANGGTFGPTNEKAIAAALVKLAQKNLAQNNRGITEAEARDWCRYRYPLLASALAQIAIANSAGPRNAAASVALANEIQTITKTGKTQTEALIKVIEDKPEIYLAYLKAGGGKF